MLFEPGTRMHCDSGFLGVWRFSYGPVLLLLEVVAQRAGAISRGRIKTSIQFMKRCNTYETVQYNLTYIGEQSESCLFFAERNNLASSI